MGGERDKVKVTFPQSLLGLRTTQHKLSLSGRIEIVIKTLGLIGLLPSHQCRNFQQYLHVHKHCCVM